MKQFIFTSILVCLFMSTPHAFAQSMGLPIHGQLEEPTSTTYTVRLYDADGAELLSDSGELKTDEDGRYTLHVARGASHELFLTARSLELQFGDEVLEPRIELGYVPVAKLAENAERFGGLTPDVFFKKGDQINYNDITGAPLIPEAKAPLKIEDNAIVLGLCGDNQLLMVDTQQWVCRNLPVYRAGDGLSLSNGTFAIANGGITSQMIAADAVTNTHIARDAIRSAQVQSGAILDRHVTSISADKVAGTAAILNTNADQAFGSTFAIRPNARQVVVGTGGTPTTLEVNGDIEVLGKAQYKSVKIKTVFISAQSFRPYTTNAPPAGAVVERGGIRLLRSGLNGLYSLYKQIDVYPGDEIQTVRCYHRGNDTTSTSQYTAELVESPYSAFTYVTLAQRTGTIRPRLSESVVVNSSGKTVKADHSYALWLRLHSTNGFFLGCKVDVLTRRL